MTKAFRTRGSSSRRIWLKSKRPRSAAQKKRGLPASGVGLLTVSEAEQGPEVASKGSPSETALSRRSARRRLLRCSFRNPDFDYGGEEGVRGLIQMSRDTEVTGGQIILAAGPEGAKGVLMPISGYYYEEDCGAIPA